jgi:hypothetical protein
MAATVGAADTVFGITELVEEIFNFLKFEDLTKCRAVCCKFRKVLANTASREIKRRSALHHCYNATSKMPRRNIEHPFGNLTPWSTKRFGWTGLHPVEMSILRSIRFWLDCIAATLRKSAA